MKVQVQMLHLHWQLKMEMHLITSLVDKRVTIICLIVSKISRRTLKMATIFLNGLQNGGYNGMMNSTIIFLKSTPHKSYALSRN